MNRLFKGITASATIVRDKDNHKLSVEASAGVGGISLVKAQLYSDGEILVTEASRFSNNSYYITNETISSYLNEKNIDISPYNDKPLESLFDDGTVLTKYFEDIRSELKDAEIEKMGRKIIECDGLDVETTCYSMESDTYSLLLYIDDDFNVIMTEARSNGYTIRVKCDDENREFTQGILHIEGDNMLLELEYKYSYKILEDESIEELPTDSAVNIEDIGDFDFESIIPDGIINFD